MPQVDSPILAAFNSGSIHSICEFSNINIIHIHNKFKQEHGHDGKRKTRKRSN